MSSALKDYIPILVPFLTFVLGIISGGVVVPRLTAKRKLLEWAIVSENDVIPKELSLTLGIPVTLQVGGDHPTSIGTVRIGLYSGGNDVIDAFEAVVRFNVGTRILSVRANGAEKEFENKVACKTQEHTCTVGLPFFNPGERVELEFVLSGYEMSSAIVSASASGLKVAKREVNRLRAETIKIGSLALPVLPTPRSTTESGVEMLKEIAKELRALRQGNITASLPPSTAALGSPLLLPPVSGATNNSGTETRGFQDLTSVYQYVTSRIDAAKTSVDDLTWGAGTVYERTDPERDMFSAYLEAIRKCSSKGSAVRYREVMNTSIHRERAREFLEAKLPNYHLRRPKESTKRLPMLSFMLIDQCEVIFAFHPVPDLKTPNVDIGIAVKEPKIVHLFQVYFNEIWAEATDVTLNDV